MRSEVINTVVVNTIFLKSMYFFLLCQVQSVSAQLSLKPDPTKRPPGGVQIFSVAKPTALAQKVYWLGPSDSAFTVTTLG